MARRQRCVSCWKLFTPNYRNRTKASARQKVCTECGAVVGHQFADRRYRSGQATQPRARASVGASTSFGSPDLPPSPALERPGDAAPDTDIARLVHTHLAAIAALVEAARPRSAPGAGPSRSASARNDPS